MKYLTLGSCVFLGLAIAPVAPVATLAHHDPAPTVAHHQPTTQISHHQPSTQTAKVRAIDWETTPGMLGLRSQIGQTLSVICPAGQPTEKIWGTDIYSDGSSICTAAVHAGLVEPTTGGNVTVKVLGSQTDFVGTERNGITTSSYGPWGGSFEVE
ncbi:LCCL domain-containing protein [Picosynechococcus sp. PCC 7117]|uniref:LCCL domain-containing protein n=1 Tax=Picosynechococcus sp. PCC 7117 TaxID=195498 RepID=UPI000810DD5F|nr:LCCL domain-containing protein [Picosynechococcus sp. PCC 7117]ANV87598.1 hypothetical protein AWQ22_09065 [Picosynechococcus sp. PCC 7117]